MSLNDRRYMRGPGGGASPGDGRRMLFSLIWANVIVFFIAWINPGIISQLQLTSEGIRNYRLYELVTAGFLHYDFFHILFNMWGLYLFGSLVAPHIGGKRFLLLYLIGAVAGNLLFLAFNWQNQYALLGASGAVYAVMVGAALFEPDRRFVMIFAPAWPIRTSTMVICYTIIEILSQLSGMAGNVAHLAHLGGVLGGYLFLKAIYRSKLPWDPFRKRVRPGDWRQPPPFDARRSDPPPGRGGHGPVSSHELDLLLDKVSRHGINSLSEQELARLRQAREEMRGGKGR